MQLTYSFNLYKSDYKNYDDIIEMMYISAKLYNQTINLIQNGLKSKEYENICTLDKKLKSLNDNNYYRMLKAQCSQQIIKLAQKSWKSYFKSLNEYKNNKSKFTGKPKEPKEKEMYILIYTNQCSKIKDNEIFLSKTMNKIKIPEYKNKDFTTFNCIRLIPRYNFIKVEIVYTVEEINENVDDNKYMSIDLGIDNICSIITDSKAILIDGKDIKSINQYYNKLKSKLKRIQNKKKILKKKLIKLYSKRENKIKDKLHKISRYIVNYCIKNKIGNIICGYNKQWKDSINIGKTNNQKFLSIPHNNLVNYLLYKCKLVGINFILQEESYTSKCDALSIEPVEKHSLYKGKRINRGLFQSSIGKLINADINGALNILRKCIGDVLVNNILKPADRGFLFNPVRVRL